MAIKLVLIEAGFTLARHARHYDEFQSLAKEHSRCLARFEHTWNHLFESFLERSYHVIWRNFFLLQPQVLPLDDLICGALLQRQIRWLPSSFLTCSGPMTEAFKRKQVHIETSNARKAAPQSCQDMEPVLVDVTPVISLALAEPADSMEQFGRIALS